VVVTRSTSGTAPSPRAGASEPTAQHLSGQLAFLVIGAQKSGTTTLFEVLRHHPELWIPPDKEAPFFSHVEPWGRGWDWYQDKVFGDAPRDRLWGTVTPQYMGGAVWSDDPSDSLRQPLPPEEIVPDRIWRTSPDVRLVCILRDPLERAVSHYRMLVLVGQEQRPLPEALSMALRPQELARSRLTPEGPSYVALSEYGRILKPYFDRFPRQSLLVQYTSDLDTDPGVVVDELVAFIGASREWLKPDLTQRYRVGATERVLSLNPYAAQKTLSDKAPLRRLWHALPPPVRRRADRLFNIAAYRIELHNRKAETERPDVPAPLAEALRDHFMADRQLLASLIGHEPRF
jgi:hypothetical protein